LLHLLDLLELFYAVISITSCRLKR
jgi:hypothetical protein